MLTPGVENEQNGRDFISPSSGEEMFLTCPPLISAEGLAHSRCSGKVSGGREHMKEENIGKRMAFGVKQTWVQIDFSVCNLC